jgi:hypothetical protein
MRMKMPGQMGESDPALPYEKMTLQYDECTRVEENGPSKLRNILREIKNMDAAECRAPSLTPRCADAGDAGLDKMPAHTRGETQLWRCPGGSFISLCWAASR